MKFVVQGVVDIRVGQEENKETLQEMESAIGDAISLLHSEISDLKAEVGRRQLMVEHALVLTNIFLGVLCCLLWFCLFK